MRFAKKPDLFLLAQTSDDAVVFTSNQNTTKYGKAVMGRGIALTAKKLCPGIDADLGKLLLSYGNHVYDLGNYQMPNGISPHVMSMPTKYCWWNKSELTLIKRSCQELVEAADKLNLDTVYFPLPGCNNGGLNPKDVLPVIANILDDRFVLVSETVDETLLFSIEL